MSKRSVDDGSDTRKCGQTGLWTWSQEKRYVGWFGSDTFAVMMAGSARAASRNDGGGESGAA